MNSDKLRGWLNLPDGPTKIGTLVGELVGATVTGSELVVVDGRRRVRTTIGPKDDEARNQVFAFVPVSAPQAADPA